MSPSVWSVLFYVFFLSSFSVFLMLSCTCPFPTLTLMPSLPERRGNRASWKLIRMDSFIHRAGERLRMKQGGSAGLCREQAGHRAVGRPQESHSVGSLEAWLLAFLPSS